MFSLLSLEARRKHKAYHNSRYALAHYTELEKHKRRNNEKPRIEREHALHKRTAGKLKFEGYFLNTCNKVGEVPGIKEGDEFESRAEMYVIGLHCLFEGGIAYIKEAGFLLATSIVDSSRYGNVSSEDWFLYSGCGGDNGTNQKLQRGHLALKNCIVRKTPVRLVRKDRLTLTFRYCGLFLVRDFKESIGKDDNIV